MRARVNQNLDIEFTAEGSDPTLAGLKKDIAKVGGDLLLVQGGDWGQPGNSAAGWETRRLGPTPPDALVTLAMQASSEVFAAVGISPLLFSSTGAGNAAREAWRQTLAFVIKPLGMLVEAELARKLETPVVLDFASLAGSDLQVKSRAFSSLASAGVDIDRALQIAGLAGPR